MTNPFQMLTALRVISELPWMPLTAADHSYFADAGPEARICQNVPLPAQRHLCEALEMPTFAWGMLAIIGGDGMQIEFHGQDAAGDPLAFALPLALVQH